MSLCVNSRYRVPTVCQAWATETHSPSAKTTRAGTGRARSFGLRPWGCRGGRSGPPSGPSPAPPRDGAGRLPAGCARSPPGRGDAPGVRTFLCCASSCQPRKTEIPHQATRRAEPIGPRPGARKGFWEDAWGPLARARRRWAGPARSGRGGGRPALRAEAGPQRGRLGPGGHRSASRRQRRRGRVPLVPEAGAGAAHPQVSRPPRGRASRPPLAGWSGGRPLPVRGLGLQGPPRDDRGPDASFPAATHSRFSTSLGLGFLSRSMG